MSFSNIVYKAIEKIVGQNYVYKSKEDLFCYSFDATGISCIPSAVVFPQNEKHVSQIMALAGSHRIPIIPRGSGTGLTGGAVPVQGSIVLVTSLMNRILEIDKENFIARVQPGVVVGDFHRTVEAKGLFYPPDPASSAVCTIGGNVAECAGGPKAVKYGVTRDYVLGLKAVLPSGQLIKTGVSTAKGVAGYDLTRLIIGSEGTLAFVTEITVKLLPKPEQIKTMAVFFQSAELAAKAVSGIIRQAIIPRCIEFLDEESLNLIRNNICFAIPSSANAMLLIEIDGPKESIEKDAILIKNFCYKNQAVNFIIASDKKTVNELWNLRKGISSLLFKIANNKINEDIVIPISKIPDMIRHCMEIQKKYDIKVVSFGHAGDGNLHCNIMYDQRNEDQFLRAQKAVNELFETTLRLGGTITGEHGIGLTKKRFLPREIGSVELNLMKKIKKEFDPDNILNPGKIF